MKKAVCFAMVLAMLALMALGGCTAGEKELRKVKLNEVTRSVFYAPLYCAVTLGYFEKEGMEVEIVTSGGSDKSMTALISGDADVALMGPETGIYVVNQGLEGHPMIVAQITKRDGKNDKECDYRLLMIPTHLQPPSPARFLPTFFF